MSGSTHALLALRDIEFGYDGMTSPLFTALNVEFPSGWTGIVGANGAGKTTLLRLAAGEIEPKSGGVIRRGTALYVAQRTDEPPERWEEFFWAPNAAALKSRLRVGEDWDAPERWQTLSHGERKRAQIAVALWLESALLALDEPTNHIDAAARELLAAALRDYRGTGLLVSHDRELLDELCAGTLVVEPPSATLRPGGVTAALAAADAEDAARERKSGTLRHAAARLREEAQHRRMLGEQKAAAARGSKQKKNPRHDPDGREKRNLAKVTNKNAWPEKQAGQLQKRAGHLDREAAEIGVKKRYETGIWVDDASYLPRDFLMRMEAGEIALDANGELASSSARRILHHPALSLGGSDRIALTGANGLGKTTLLRHILARLTLPPERLIFVPQEITAAESRALLEVVKRLPESERGRVMTTVSRLGSRPGRLLESAQPSPGEVRKLLLSLGIVRGPSLIVMDEPTNHLDLPGILCLENALSECPCAMLLVSHDKRFLAKTTSIEWRLAADHAGANNDTYVEIIR